MGKIISYEKEAREGIQLGVQKLAKAVKTTLGARGRNVLIEDPDGTTAQITKDGVTVARSIVLDDPLERMGCNIVKKVALSTNEEVGDGTTTSIVLAEAMLNEGINYIDKTNVNPISLKRGMDKAVVAVLEYLKQTAIPVNGNPEFIEQIATISANNDSTIGKLISKAFEQVGKHGVIKIDQSTTNDHYITLTEGLGFDRGYIHPIFTGSLNADSVELENPLILITDYQVQDISEFGIDEVESTIPLLEEIKKQDRPLLIICDDMDVVPAQYFGRGMATRTFVNVVVKAPEFGNRRVDVLEDIALVTNGIFVTKEKGMKLKDITIDMLGSAESVFVTETDTTIKNGAGSEETVNERIEFIKSQLESETDEFAKGKLEERLAKLTGGIATIHIGAKSEVELGEVKDRVEDALNATKAALAEGVVAGGGVTLFKATEVLKIFDVENPEEEYGVKVISKALESPLLSILSNAGENSEEVVSNIQKNSNYRHGYDVKGRRYGDMVDLGILDPVKVTRTALENAASITGTLLTTECVVNNKHIQQPLELNLEA